MARISWSNARLVTAAPTPNRTSNRFANPAASIPLLAARHGVPYVIIHRGPTGHDDLPEVTLQFEGDVTELFPPLVRAALAAA